VGGGPVSGFIRLAMENGQAGMDELKISFRNKERFTGRQHHIEPTELKARIPKRPAFDEAK